MRLRPAIAQCNRFRSRLNVEALEDRATPTVSTIVSNFNGTKIPAGDTVWFNSVTKVTGLGSGTETLFVKDGMISFTSNGTPYTVNLPDMTITFTTLATSASTSYDASGWHITTPPVTSGNLFLGGVPLPVPGGLPGGIKDVTWSANFTADAAGMKVNWQWAAAVYTSFGSPGELGVKTVDNGNLDAVYHNSDHAATPEAFKQFVIGGARGGGGSNYTGSYSGTASLYPEVVQPPTDNSASISGTVIVDNRDGTFSVAEGITIVLSDGDGHTFTTSTNQFGNYSFSGLAEGTYSIHESLPTDSPLFAVSSQAGTVSVGSAGESTSNTDITSVSLIGGSIGVDYNFVLSLGEPPT